LDLFSGHKRPLPEDNTFGDLFRSADIGMIAEINLTGAVLLGEERQRLVQRRFAGFVSIGGQRLPAPVIPKRSAAW